MFSLHPIRWTHDFICPVINYINYLLTGPASSNLYNSIGGQRPRRIPVLPSSHWHGEASTAGPLWGQEPLGSLS